MNIKDFADTVEFNIRHGVRHAILGLGAPGVGKSQVIRQIGKKYDYKVIDLRLAQMSEVEIGGLIYPNKERTKTVWLSPDVLPDEERDGPRTILLLDEITSCTKRVQVAAYQLILDRRIGQYKLPKGTMVVALGNREDDDGVYIRLAGPLADRFEIHYIDVDFDCWLNDYAIPCGVHPWVVDYLRENPASLHTQAEAGDSMVFATPRSWDRVSDILRMDADLTKPVVRHKIAGNVGTEEAALFVAWCGSRKPPLDVKGFLAGRCQAPRDVDSLLELTQALAKECSFVAEAASYDALSDGEKQTLANVLERLCDLPYDEIATQGLRGVYALNRDVVKEALAHTDAPGVTDLISRHAHMLSLTNGSDRRSERKRWQENF